MPTLEIVKLLKVERVPLIHDDSERYQIGQNTFIASNDMGGEMVDIPVTIVGHAPGDNRTIVQFNADDDYRDVLKGQIHVVDTFYLTIG